MIHLIVLPSTEETEGEESHEELVTRILGEENCIPVWPDVFLAESKLTASQVKEKLELQIGGRQGMIATIGEDMLAGVGPANTVQWYRSRSSKK